MTPMRVLHLLDVNSPWGGPCTQRLAADVIARLQQAEFGGWTAHDVLLIGGRRDAITAAECGLHVLGTICPLGTNRGRTIAARTSLARWLQAARFSGALPTLIHSWTSTTGALAALAAPKLPRVVTMHSMAIDPRSPHLTPRVRVRERWFREYGLALDQFVLGMLSEPPERFDARQAMHVGARTGLSSRRVSMVMSGRTFGRTEQQRCLAQLGLDHSIIQDELMLRPWEVAAGLDAALVLAPLPEMWSSPHASRLSMSALPALWAIAAGVPVIAESHAPLHGLIRHEHTGLLVPPGDMNQACDRLLRLYDDRHFAGRMAEAARSEAAQRFSMDLFCSRLNDAYHRVLADGRAEYIDVPASA